jgi:hypothetical protein
MPRKGSRHSEKKGSLSSGADRIQLKPGEVRVPDMPPNELKQIEVEIVIDVSELVWVAPAD